MAYVRKRGKQLLIVQGMREPQSGKVGQQTLFTIYSKAEALQILGRGEDGRAFQFRDLLEHQYPAVRFNWKRLYEGIEANLEVLPDLYEYQETRLRSQFRKDLCAFARQLMLSDPQDFVAAGSLIEQHRVELDYLVELIQWRMERSEQQRTEWNVDNPFYWRFALQGSGVPPDIEEHVADYYERGDYDRAEVLFQFLIDCFDGYAEGYNYLGLIALHRERLEEAIERFRKGMELGRKQFPKRMARSRYWIELSTRPYMRTMRNLTLALSGAGRYEESLQYCDRLEQECGDEISPAAYRASIYLNTGRWQEAAASARKICNLDASDSLVEAFALFELGRREDAIASFLHGVLNYPGAAKILLGMRTRAPRDYEQARDHNAGVDIYRDLKKYLSGRGRQAKRFFKGLFEAPQVSALVAELEAVRKRRREQHQSGDREAFDRMTQMQKPEFARREAAKLALTELGIGIN